MRPPQGTNVLFRYLAGGRNYRVRGSRYSCCLLPVPCFYHYNSSAADAPAKAPVDQAIWRLKPPVWASTSSTSPAK